MRYSASMRLFHGLDWLQVAALVLLAAAAVLAVILFVPVPG